MTVMPRRQSVGVDIGGVMVGGGAPIVVQSMTNTDTADVEATARQVAQLARAGSELVRITVDRAEAAAAVPHIRDRLHATRTATIYTSDVPEESPDFAAVQWWGSLGGFTALDRTTDDEPADYGRRGPNLIVQYKHAFPDHAVELDKPLDDTVRAAWLELAKSSGVNLDGLEAAATRGDYIRRAWKNRR